MTKGPRFCNGGPENRNSHMIDSPTMHLSLKANEVPSLWRVSTYRYFDYRSSMASQPMQIELAAQWHFVP